MKVPLTFQNYCLGYHSVMGPLGELVLESGIQHSDPLNPLAIFSLVLHKLVVSSFDQAWYLDDGVLAAWYSHKFMLHEDHTPD